MVERSMTTFEPFATLSDPDQLSAVRAAAQHECTSTAELTELLVHVDNRASISARDTARRRRDATRGSRPITVEASPLAGRQLSPPAEHLL
jgi:hypothetical protein